MSESTRQAQIAAAIADLFQDGSILINDYATPQVTSRAAAPWAIIAMSDDVIALPGESWSNQSARYGVFLTLLDYQRERNEKEFLDKFQAIRQSVIGALVAVPGLANRIETAGPLGPWFTENGEPDPDAIAQRLMIEVTDYEV